MRFFHQVVLLNVWSSHVRLKLQRQFCNKDFSACKGVSLGDSPCYFMSAVIPFSVEDGKMESEDFIFCIFSLYFYCWVQGNILSEIWFYLFTEDCRNGSLAAHNTRAHTQKKKNCFIEMQTIKLFCEEQKQQHTHTRTQKKNVLLKINLLFLFKILHTKHALSEEGRR